MLRGGLLLLALTSLAARPPAARLGSTERDQTPVVEAPIDRVTVYSNRAQVTRAARPLLPSGPTVLRFERLPPTIEPTSVRVSATGARVLRAEVSSVQTEAIAVDSFRAQLEKLEALQASRQALVDARQLAREELELIQTLQPASFVEAAQRNGRPLPKVSMSGWLETADFFIRRADQSRKRIESLHEDLRPLDREIKTLADALSKLKLGNGLRRYTEVWAVVDSPRAKATSVRLTYRVPGPRWQPVYDLHYDPVESALVVYTGAVVAQQTGEDWTDANLSFSTGVPEDGIALPPLLTWTLGEKGDFLPVVKAKRAPAAPRPQAPVSPPPSRRFETEEEVRALKARLAKAIDAPGATAPAPRARRRQPEREPASSPPRDEARQSAPDSRRILNTGSVASSIESSSFGGRRDATYVRRNLALTQRQAPSLLTALGGTPAAMTGGVEFIYDSPTRSDVRSDGEAIKIPVAVERFKTDGFYEATPGLATTAYLRARLTNESTRPMLAGPTNIFVGGRFIGQGAIRTTAPQKQVEFGLGADESIKLTRRVVPTTREEGVFTTHAVTRYRILIQAVNYHRQAVRLEVLEPVPKSTHEDIEVELLEMTPKPSEGPDADGILRFVLPLEPGAKKTIEIIYAVDRPADLELRQN